MCSELITDGRTGKVIIEVASPLKNIATSGVELGSNRNLRRRLSKGLKEKKKILSNNLVCYTISPPPAWMTPRRTKSKGYTEAAPINPETTNGSSNQSWTSKMDVNLRPFCIKILRGIKISTASNIKFPCHYKTEQHKHNNNNNLQDFPKRRERHYASPQLSVSSVRPHTRLSLNEGIYKGWR